MLRTSKWLNFLVGMAALALMPAAALADHWHDHGRAAVIIRPDPIYVAPAGPPVIVDHHDDVWVEPVYHTVTEHVWVPPVTQPSLTAVDHVWVPDRYDYRDVVTYDHGWRHVSRQYVLVDPGHFEDRPQQVVVAPGHYEDVQKLELVTPGHWEPRTVVVVPAPPPPAPGISVDVHVP